MLKGRPDQQLRGSALGQSLSRTRWVAFVSHSSHFLRREISLLARQASALVAALIRGRARVLRQAKAHKLTYNRPCIRSGFFTHPVLVSLVDELALLNRPLLSLSLSFPSPLSSVSFSLSAFFLGLCPFSVLLPSCMLGCVCVCLCLPVYLLSPTPLPSKLSIFHPPSLPPFFPLPPSLPLFSSFPTLLSLSPHSI